MSKQLMFDKAMRWYLIPSELVIAFKEAREEPTSAMLVTQFAEHQIKKKCSLEVNGETYHYDPTKIPVLK